MHTETSVKKRCLERFVELGVSKEINALIEKNCEKAPNKLIDHTLYILPECQDSYMVLINGKLVHKVCPGVTILALDEAMSAYSTLLLNSMAKCAKESANSLELLNLAMSDAGACIMLSPKCSAKKPLQIISIIDAPSASVMPRIHLFAAQNSELTLVQTKVVLADCFYNSLLNIQCEDGARIVLEEVQHSTSLSHFEHIRVQLKRSSVFNSRFVNGSHRNIQVALTGAGAEADASGIWLLQGKEAINTTVCMDHHEPNCRSMQLFKGVLQDNASSNFDGKIYVRQKAQKTESYQLNKNLLLSEGAKAKTTPNLEIFADDVKASHGATVGRLDPEHLFYLASRGISQKEATNFLVRGFCEEVVAKLSTRSLQDKANQYLVPVERK